MFRSIFLSMLVLVGCAEKELPLDSSQSPLIFDPVDVQQADTIAILVPGALAPIEIFSPAAVWKDAGYALVHYRFPGLDGLPLDHRLGIENAARQIADFANSYPEKRIRLLGYSTGGPIVIVAANDIGSEDVKVAAMSPAVQNGGGLCTVMRGTYDVAAAAIRAGSFRWDEVWLEYYRTLLFGRKGLSNPELADEIEAIVRREKGKIVVPSSSLSEAHSADLRDWEIDEGFRADPDKVRFYIGAEDPVFSTEQTQEFAQAIGVTTVQEFPDQGHLIFLTRPDIFTDIFDFFEEEAN